MNTSNHLSPLTHCMRAGALAVLAAALPLGHAGTLWTGPTTNWTKSVSTPSDTVLTGKVVLTRGSRDVLYNLAVGETFAGLNSPADTEWAFGTLANTNLIYQSLESMRNGFTQAIITNRPMVMHIISEDIYVSVVFTLWGSGPTLNSGQVAYTRSTPPAEVAPSVSITNPAGGATFAAPANVNIGADATVAGGTVTNVSFFTNSALLGSVQSPPFNLTATGLAAGAYSLTAVATAAGLSTTSAVVSISVVSPGGITLVGPQVSGGQVSFSYTANPGSSYVVERSTDLSGWTPVVTNVASGSSVPFSESSTASPAAYYRVARLPNP